MRVVDEMQIEWFNKLNRPADADPFCRSAFKFEYAPKGMDSIPELDYGTCSKKQDRSAPQVHPEWLTL